MEKEKFTQKVELTWETFVSFLSNINFISTYEEASILMTKKNLIEYPQINFDKFNDVIHIDDKTERRREMEEMMSESKRLYRIEIDYPLLYELYRDIHRDRKDIYIFEEFHNIFKILNYILIHFKEILSINCQNVLFEKIIFFHVDNSEELNNFSHLINQKITQGHKKIQNLLEEEIFQIKNLLFLFYIFTMCGRLILHNPITIEDYLYNVNEYCKFFISHFKYNLLVHIGMVILYHISYREEMNTINTENMFKNKDNEIMTTHRNNLNDLISTVRNFTPTLFFINFQNPNISLSNDEPHDFLLEDEFNKLIFVTNLSKYFLCNYFTVKVKINLKFVNFEYFRKTIFFFEFSSDLNSGIEKLNVNMKQNLNSDNFILNLLDMNFLRHKNYFIEEICIHLIKLKNEDLYSGGNIKFFEKIFNSFDKIFKKSSHVLITDNISPNSNYVSIEIFLSQFDLIHSFIDYLSKIFKSRNKKTEKFSFTIQLNFFTVQMSEATYDNFFSNSNSLFSFGKSKTRKYFLSLITNYSNLEEREFLQFLSVISCFVKLHKKFFDLMRDIKDKFKKVMNAQITFLQQNLKSEELNSMILLLSLSLHNFLEEKKLKHIHVLETTKTISPKHTLFLSDIYKEKDKKNLLHKFLDIMQNPSVNIFNKFSDNLILYFNDIIITDMIDNKFPFKNNTLFRSFNNNKISILCKEDRNYSIDIYVYDSKIYDNIIRFVKILKIDKTLGDLISEIRMIFYDKIFREILIEKEEHSEEYKNLFSLVDKIYIVSANSNYDIYVFENKLCILLHTPIATKINRNKLSQEEMEENTIKLLINKILMILTGAKNPNLDILNTAVSMIDNKPSIALQQDNLASLNNKSLDLDLNKKKKKDNLVDNNFYKYEFSKNLIQLLLDCRERYFTHIQLIYKLFPDAELNMINLSDNYLAVRKLSGISSKNKIIPIKDLTELFNNFYVLKSNQTYPEFILYCTDQKNEKYSLRYLINTFIQNFCFNNIKNEFTKKSSTNIRKLIKKDEKSSNIDDFIQFLHQKIFSPNYDNFIPIAFSQKSFFLLMKLFYNLYENSGGSLFKNIYIIPLMEENDAEYFINCNQHQSSFENFLEKLKNFYFPDSFYYFIANNIKVFQSKDENSKNYDKSSVEFWVRMIKRGIPFSYSNIDNTMKLIKRECERENLEKNKSVLEYSSQQVYSVLYSTYSKNYFCRSLKKLRNKRIFKKLKDLLKVEVVVEFQESKFDMLHTINEGQIKLNKSQTNVDSRHKVTEEVKIMMVANESNIKDEKSEDDSKKKRKKSTLNSSSNVKNNHDDRIIETDSLNKKKKCLIY